MARNSTKKSPVAKNALVQNSMANSKPVGSKKVVQSFTKDFLKFLKEYSVLGIAMGLVIGAAVNSLVQSIVNGLITPLIQLIVPSDFFKNLTYKMDGVTFAIGPIINAVINFFIVAFLFFIFARVFLKKKEVTKETFK